IYEIAGKLIAQGKAATPITLRTFLENAAPISPTLTVPQYLGRLATNAATVINARDYGQTIYDLAVRRHLIVIGEDIVNAAYDAAIDFPPKEQIEEAEGRLYALASAGKAEAGVFTFGEAAAAAARSVQEAAQRGGIIGLSTGLSALDKIISGLGPGELIILA